MSTKLIFFILFCTTGKRCNYTHTIMVFLHVSYFVSCSRTCAHCTVHIRTHTRAQSIKSTLFIVILLSFLIVEALMLSYSGNPNSEHGYERLCVCVCLEIMKFMSFHKADTDGFAVKVTIMHFKRFKEMSAAAFGCDGRSWCTKKTSIRLRKIWVKERHASRSAHLSQNIHECISVFWPNHFILMHVLK